MKSHSSTAGDREPTCRRPEGGAAKDDGRASFSGIRVAVLCMFFAGLVLQIRTLALIWAVGGHHWLQGDWLISDAAGPVRRGPFGDLVLGAADLMEASPLAVVFVLQLALAVAIFAGTARLVARQRHPLMILATLSPAIFAVVWNTHFGAGFRKEYLGLAALVWLAQPDAGRRAIIGSGALVMLGGLGHEINILLLPAWMIALWLLHGNALGLWSVRAVIAVVVATVAAEAVFVLAHPRVADAAPICEALVERGLSASRLCTGAIDWLADPQNGPARVIEALGRSWTVWLWPVAALVASVPLWRLWSVSRCETPVAGWLVLLAIAPFFLLYPVGLDWGRWLAMQYSVAAVLTLGLGARSQLRPVGTVSSVEAWVFLLLALFLPFRYDAVLGGPGFGLVVVGALAAALGLV